MKVVNLLSIVSAVLMGATVAQANIFQAAGQERTDTFLQSEHSRGQNQYGIKRMLNQELSAENLSAKDFKLVGVTLYAKSKQGRGKAKLVIGNQGDQKRVLQAPRGRWQGPRLRSFNVIEWDLSHNPAMASEGRWQMHLKGNIKVHHMDVHLQSQFEKVRIRIGDDIYGTGPRAVSDKIQIKKALRNAGYRPRDYKLKAVRLVGKSRRGRGKASLMIGSSNKGTKVLDVAQNGYGFQSTQGQSYNRVKWLGMNASAQGHTWQMHFRGANRVKAMVLVLAPAR